MRPWQYFFKKITPFLTSHSSLPIHSQANSSAQLLGYLRAAFGYNEESHNECQQEAC